LRDVERPHGLPTGHRQRRVTRGGCLWFRDVDYLRYDLVAELDGRLGHERYADRAGDMERDAIGATDGKTTIRLGYQQVIVTPCRTAQHVVDLLRVHGWPGQARQCGPTCPVR
jgi:very-short-patch-repair endonuclease